MMERIRELGAGLAVIGCGLLIFLALTARVARADTWAVASVASYHTDRDAHYNERNGGLGIEHDIADNARLIAGFYRNSLYRESMYLGATFTPLHVTDHIRVGVIAAFVTGYNINDGNAVPMAALLVQVEGERVGINLGAIPRSVASPGLVGLQIKVKF
jgi:hypothetical protein